MPLCCCFFKEIARTVVGFIFDYKNSCGIVQLFFLLYDQCEKNSELLTFNFAKTEELQNQISCLQKRTNMPKYHTHSLNFRHLRLNNSDN